MRIRISAEPFEPKLVAFDKSKQDAWLIKYGDNRLPIDIWKKFREWHERYMPFTDLKSPEEVLANKRIIEALDEEGLILTREISKNLKDENVERFFYFSYGYYYFISIDNKGKEKKVLNPIEKDWYYI